MDKDNKGTVLTSKDIVKAFQDFYNSFPDHVLNPPTFNWQEAIKREEQMRKKRFK